MWHYKTNFYLAHILFFAVNFGVGGQVFGANKPSLAQRTTVRLLARVRWPLVPLQIVLALVRQFAVPALERPVARVHPKVARQLKLLETSTKSSVYVPLSGQIKSVPTYIRIRYIRTVWTRHESWDGDSAAAVGRRCSCMLCIRMACRRSAYAREALSLISRHIWHAKIKR